MGHNYSMAIPIYTRNLFFKLILIYKNQRLSSPMKIVLLSEVDPPINPLACTKSISSIPDKFTSFYMSLMPLHSSFSPFLSINEPSCRETPCILHFFPLFSGKTTKRI